MSAKKKEKVQPVPVERLAGGLPGGPTLQEWCDSHRGESCCFNVLGVGTFTFRPYWHGTAQDLMLACRWVGSLQEAMAGLGYLSSAVESGIARAVEGHTHV